MPEPLAPAVGWGVLHLFCQAGPLAERDAVAAAVKAAEADGVQVVPAAMLGHKADLALMALGPDLWRLRQLQTERHQRRASRWSTATCRSPSCPSTPRACPTS